MSPRSPSTSTGCRPANCVAASACCDPWRSSTPATVASADPHDDASNCSGRLDPPRPTGPAAFRADNPAPPPSGFPESHFGRHLSTCRHDPRRVIGGSQSNARMGGRVWPGGVPSGPAAAVAWRGAAAGEASLLGMELRGRRRVRLSRRRRRRRRRRRPWRRGRAGCGCGAWRE